MKKGPKKKIEKRDVNEEDERKFLHDLANPLSTALFLVDVVLESFQIHPDLNQDELHQLRQLFESLDKVKNLIQDRREFLIKRGSTSAKQ